MDRLERSHGRVASPRVGQDRGALRGFRGGLGGDGGGGVPPLSPGADHRDIDVLIKGGDRSAVEAKLSGAGFRRERDLDFVNQPAWSGSALTAKGRRTKVDLISIDSRWVERALDEAAGNRDAEGLRVLPPPYLVLTKIESLWAQDVAGVSAMLEIALRRGDTKAIEQARKLVRRHFPDREGEFDQLLELGQWEIGPEPSS